MNISITSDGTWDGTEVREVTGGAGLDGITGITWHALQGDSVARAALYLAPMRIAIPTAVADFATARAEPAERTVYDFPECLDDPKNAALLEWMAHEIAQARARATVEREYATYVQKRDAQEGNQ